jgi:tRNA wybutosine-synthesizing protein 3
MANIFEQRKNSILSKEDKSSKNSWDEKIVDLCKKINFSDEYYTTSSCSGRIVVMKDEDKKGPNLFEFVSHDLIDVEWLKKCLPKEQAKLNLKFKQESVIIHIVCKELNNAKKLLDVAQDAGLKKCGIISLGKNIVVEINGTDKIELPFISDGKILVDDEFLKILIKKVNNNLERGWRAISRLGVGISDFGAERGRE